MTPALPTPSVESRTSAPWTFDPWTLGLIVWLAGAIALAIWQLRGQLRFLADARAGFAGPAVAGVFKPRIITPADFEDRFETSEREVILAHEKIHLDNNDARINAVVALLRCLCWFNPLVHIAAHLMRVDQELACDATVVERHPRAKAVYASALLKAQLASRPLPLGCYWPAGTEHPLTERVEMLKQAKPTLLRLHIGIATLAVLALGAGATAWAVLPPQEHVRFEATAAPVPAPEQASVATAPADEPAPPSAPQMPRPTESTNQATEQLHLLGKVEEIEFGEKSYVAYVRAYSTASCPAGPAERSNALWRLSPTPYWGDKDAVTRDLMDRDVYVRGLATRRETSCTPFCEMNAHAVVHAQNRFALFTDRTLSCGPPSNLQLESPETTRSATPIRYEPQQPPTTAPAQPARPPMAPTPSRDPGFLDTPSSMIGSGTPSPARLDAGVPIFLRGKIERLEFGASSYVVFLRATYVSNYNAGRGQERPPEPSAMAWALSPTNYFGDRASITVDLVGKEVEAHGVNVNSECKPDCRLKVTRLLFGEPSEVPPLVSSERLISQFARWYDTDAPNIISGNVERLAFHGNGRTFDAYVRSDARGAVPSRLFQVRSEYRHPQGDIERALAGKRVNVFGWRAHETAGTFCAPVCGMFGDHFTVLDASGQLENVTPDAPALTTAVMGRNVVAARIGAQNNGFRIVALKRERLQISSRDIEKFVDRDLSLARNTICFPETTGRFRHRMVQRSNCASATLRSAFLLMPERSRRRASTPSRRAASSTKR